MSQFEKDDPQSRTASSTDAAHQTFERPANVQSADDQNFTDALDDLLTRHNRELKDFLRSHMRDQGQSKQ